MNVGIPSHRDSDGLFRLVADTLPLLVWISGSDKRCTYFNKPWLDFTGRPLESEIGDGWADGVHAADLQHCLDTYARAFDRREPFLMEYRLRRHDGEYRWVLDNAAPLFDPDGSFAGYIGACFDVTEFRRAEAERNVANDRLRLAMESGKSVGWEWDLKTNRDTWFGDLPTIFGIPSNIYVGHVEDFRRSVHPEDRGLVWKAVNEALESRSPYAAEFRILWPNGTVRWVAAKGQFYYSPDGDPERTLGIAVDITERKNAEESLVRKEMELRDLQRAEEALRDSEERYRGLAEQITDGIFVTDSEGRYADANRAGCEMFGYTLDELRALTVRDVIPADELQKLPEQFERLKGGEIVRNDWRFRRKDGSIFIGELKSRLLSNGRLQGVVRDVTERKRAEDAVREADRRKDDFLATLAHELRNPLAQLSAGTAVIRMANGDPETVVEHSTIMERQLQQLARLVDDVLDLSDLTHRGLRLDQRRIELAAITRTAVEQNRILIEEAGHTISVTLPEEHIFLEADPLRLGQVLSNLLSNAVKYTPRGGHIEIAAERDGAGVRLSVRDNGFGIPPNRLDTIFEMFNQLDRSLETGYKGLGIGLSLVKSLVHMHGGTIEVQSEGLGKGSVFSVWLPITLESQPSRPAPLPHEAARSVHNTVNCRVLLVEDNRDVARSMVRLIRLLGHDIRVAFDGREALQIGGEFKPDVVLMDIGLPKLNGYDAAREIRSTLWGEKITLVAVTGWGREIDMRRSQESGFDRHLTKPVDAAVLEAFLSSCSGRGN